MKYIALLLLLVSPLAYSGDLELSVGIALSNSDVTSVTWAKPGCCYSIDYQFTQPNKNGSFGVFGGSLLKDVYLVGPTYSYVLGPISFGTAVGVDRDHGATTWGVTPVIEYAIKQVSFDLAYLESPIKASNGLIFAVGYHSTL
jgi:hypothetical protein